MFPLHYIVFQKTSRTFPILTCKKLSDLHNFGVNILDTTCHQMTVYFFSPRPMSAFALPRKKEQTIYALKYFKNMKKTSPTLLTVTCSTIIRFQYFLAQIFLTQLASKLLFVHYLEKTDQAKYALK